MSMTQAADPLRQQCEARVGTTLRGKYRLDRLLGIGGMAAVYAGTHRNGNRVAIKVLHREISIVQELRARFLREGYVANKVDHPGAVRVLDDDEAEDGAVFLAMELLDGETIEARWKREGERLPPRDAIMIAHQALAVLGAAHAVGIVHRDVKPENLFMTRAGVVKVLDFGIARMLEASQSPMTRTGRTLGTPGFMAPEQALGRAREIDAQTDVWAVGATLFTLISGRYVHEAETAEEMMVYTATRPARSLAAVTGDAVPAPIVGVVDRALAFERPARFADARAMMTALEQAHVAAYGAPIVDGRLSMPSLMETARTPVRASSDATVAQPETAPVSHAAWPEPVPSRRADPLPVRSHATTAGVARDHRPEDDLDEVAGVPRRRRAGAWALATLLLLLLGAGSVVVFETMKRGDEATSAAAIVASTAAPSTPSASLAPLEDAGPAAPARVPASATPTQTHVPLNAPKPIPTTTVTTAPTPTPSPTPAPTPTPTATQSAPKPSCDPPFTIDPDTGRKNFKPECL